MAAQIEWWDLAGLIMGGIGVAAFLMAAQPLIQVVWGRPKLEADFDDWVDPQGSKFLEASLINIPVTSRWLKRLGVRRDTIGEVTAFFKIFEVGSEREMTDSIAARFRTESDGVRYRVPLPASVYSIKCGIVAQKRGDSHVIVIETPADQNNSGELTHLQPGTYRVAITFVCGDHIVRAESRLVVNRSASRTHWVAIAS